MKKLSSIILASLVLVGCNPAPISRNAPDAEGKVFLEDNEYRMVLSEYEWNEGKVEAKKIDIVPVEEMAEKFDNLDVMKDSTVKISVGGNPSTISVNQTNVDKSVENVEITNSEITLPSTAGYYIYEIIAEWDNGRMTYVFDVNVF